MLSLKDRLNAVNAKTESKPTVMYTVEGATWQSWAFAEIGVNAGGVIVDESKYNKSASKLINSYVHKINNNEITVEQATKDFSALL